MKSTEKNSNGVNDKFLKPYNPQETEGRVYKLWEESGFFKPEAGSSWVDNPKINPNHGKSFSMIMPPTNANGSLHAGHALVMTLEDIITRYRRMRGYKTLWLPGLDHAGFETQVVYEKKLEKEGRSRFGMEPEKLYKEILDFTLENSKGIKDQVRRMGASCDWSREKFTLDKDVVETVQSTFKRMFDDGLVYRGERIVNWCSKHATSLSDVETENKERKDPFYYFKYGPFTIGTTRPETKFGDKYVVMHPDDVRYKEYAHGQTFDLEWINGPITATVIKDDSIDMEMGSGVMTITPWHTAIDFDIAERHNLPKEQVIDMRGKLLPIAGEFASMKIIEARPKIVEKLKSKGLLVKIDEEYLHNVPVCYKCETAIEPQVLPQWFVKMKPLAEKALEAVESGKITFIPDNYRKIFLYWMNNTIDWNISRQIVWGIPIPAWYCGTEAVSIKKMGFAGDIVTQVFATKTRTYRLRNHGFQVGERVAFEDSAQKKIFGYGTITEIVRSTVGAIDLADTKHWKTYEKREELISAFKRHHPQVDVQEDTSVWIYTYTFDKSIPKGHCGTLVVSEDKPIECPTCQSKEMTRDSDTFDTWFSSGQWPLLTLGFPDGSDFKTFYPTDVMETGSDLIFKWIPRMVIFGLYLAEEVPFKTVYLHGMVNDAKGQKMSKSKGNVITPLPLAEKFGTDALRIGLIAGNTPGTSLSLSEDKIRGYKHFANKLWNIARFIIENTDGEKLEEGFSDYSQADTELREMRHNLLFDVTKDMEAYRFYLAAEKLYHYSWHTLADQILEESKSVLKDGTPEEKKSRKQLLIHTFDKILKCLHPFIPFVTEEIWQLWRGEPTTDNPQPTTKKDGMLMVQKWPV